MNSQNNEPKPPKKPFRLARSFLTSRELQGVRTVIAIITALSAPAAWLISKLANVSSNTLVLLIVVVSTIIVFVLATAGLILYGLYKHFRERYQFIRNEYDGTIRSVGQIAQRLYHDDATRWRFTEAKEVITVFEDGTCEIHRHFVISASDTQPAQVWRVEIFADETAEPIQFIGDIGFRVTCLGNGPETVKYLVSKNDFRNKEITIFFLPEILPNTERTVELSYRWDQFAADLREKNSTVFAFKYQSCDQDDLANYHLEFRFAKSLGQIKLEADFPDLGGDFTDTHGGPEDEYHTWVYKHPELPMYQRTLKFTATRKREN